MANNEIKFKYLFNKEYDPEYVNGFYGGINPSGELMLHFFLERIPLPYEEVVKLDEEGAFGESAVVAPEEYKFIRSIKSGVVMNKETVSALIDWLQTAILDMEAGDDSE